MPMSITLIAAIAIGQVPDPSALVKQLGASQYAMREAAAEALRKVGVRALPALRGVETSKDEEVRARAVILVREIEKQFLTEATMVRLNVHDSPRGDAFKLIGKACQFELVDLDNAVKGILARTVSIKEKKPLPFWQAIDRLCSDDGLRFEPSSDPGRLTDDAAAPVPINLKAGRCSGPIDQHGPFRVTLLALRHTRQFTFDQDSQVGRNPRAREEFVASFSVMSEPRVMMIRRGPIQLAEAVDDLDHSFLLPEGRQPEVQPALLQGPELTQQRHHARLRIPPQQGKVLRRLRGSIPIHVAARLPETLDIPLKASRGKAFSCSEVSITVEQVQPEPNEQTVQLTIRPRTSKKVLEQTDLGSIPELAILFGYGPLLDRQMVVIDDRGAPLPFSRTYEIAKDGSVKVALTLPSGATSVRSRETTGRQAPPKLNPTRLLYYPLARVDFEIPFEFRDIPLP